VEDAASHHLKNLNENQQKTWNHG